MHEMFSEKKSHGEFAQRTKQSDVDKREEIQAKMIFGLIFFLVVFLVIYLNATFAFDTFMLFSATKLLVFMEKQWYEFPLSFLFWFFSWGILERD